jgi:hypothetical protein
MSDGLIVLVVTGALAAILFGWVPLLNFICPPQSRERRQSEKMDVYREMARLRESIPEGVHLFEVPPHRVFQVESDSRLAQFSQRPADETRDLRQAISSRGVWNNVRTQPAMLRSRVDPR